MFTRDEAVQSQRLLAVKIERRRFEKTKAGAALVKFERALIRAAEDRKNHRSSNLWTKVDHTYDQLVAVIKELQSLQSNISDQELIDILAKRIGVSLED